MTVNFRGYVFQDDGDAVSGATVKLLETGTATTEATTTTDSDGLWYFNEADQDRYDVEITEGNSVRYIRWDDQVSFKEVDVRNNTGATTPAATFTNLTNSAANQVAVFSGANSTKADNDEIYLSFKMHDSAGNLDEFARMTVVAKDVTTTTEDGQIEFDVMKAGTLTPVWTITSSDAAAMSFDMNVDALTIGSGGDADITLTFDANTADGVITWMEDEDYFKFSDDILMNGTERISFYDTAIYIYSSADGQLDLVADTEIQIAATTIDINGAVAFNGALTGITNITLTGTLSDGNYTFDTSGNVSGLGTIGSGNITSTGTVQGTVVTATTGFAPDASDGAYLGTASLEFSDLFLADGAVINLGDDQDVTLTHVADAGILLNSTMKIQFGDAGTFIHQSADGVLTIESDTTVDINGAVVLNGAITGATDITLSGELDAATLDLSSSADIAGDLVLSGGADGALQFTNAGENSIKIPDNQASALIIEEADNAYITFVTTNGSEAITIAKATTFSAGIANTGTIAAGTWNGTAIATSYIAGDAITGAKIADDAIDSEHYTDGSIDTAHLAADVITGAKVADDAIDSEHYAAASIDFAHIQNIAANSILGRDANSSGVLSEVALATTQILIGDGTGFTPAALSGDATMTNAGVVSLAAAQTNVTSLLATDIKIGEDAQTLIDFETANEIHFDADNAERVKIDSTGLNIVSGSLETATIDYTDGDLAMTIADGGGVTFAQATTFSGGITNSGTIAAGTWQGTDVGVAYGGTGVSTLADNAVLTGTGASAITAEANLTFDGSTLTLDGDLDFTGPQTISTSSGNLTIGAATGADVLIGDNETILYVDGGTGTVGIGEAATNAILNMDVTFAANVLGPGIVADNRRHTTSFTGTIMANVVSNQRLTDSNSNNFNSVTVGIVGFESRFYTDAGGSGTVTGFGHVYINDASLSGATVTNQYGIYIKNLTAGTNDYGIYIAGADTYAIWVDAGTSRFDGDIDLNNTGTLLNVGASGNDWTTNALTLAGGASEQLLTVKTTGGSTDSEFIAEIASGTTGEALFRFKEGDGSGSANNMSYVLAYSANGNYLRCWSSDTDGSSTNADIWRIPDGQTSIDANTTWDDNVFDDYDDAAVLSPYRQGQFNLSQRKDDLIEMGILREHEDGWIGYNDQRMAALLAGGIYQNRERMDAQHHTIDERLKRIEQALGV